MTRNKIVALLAASAALGLALFTTGTTGVLASWQESVWSGAEFGVDQNYVPVGYARSIAARGEIRRAITVGRIDGTDVTRSDSNPGGASTGWQSFSSDGVAALFSLDLDGSSSATFDPTGQTSSTGAPVPVADALSQMRNFTGRATAISSPYMSSSGTFTASAVCPINGDPPSAGMTTGTLTIGGQSIDIPEPGQSVEIDVRQGSRHFEGRLTRIQSTTESSALSELTLYLDQTLILTHEWTLEMQLVRAECGIGITSQSSAFGTLGSGTAQDDLATSNEDPTVTEEDGAQLDPGEESDADDVEPEAEADTGTEESESVGPTSPVNVDLNESFDVIATDGTRLGSARVEDVRATASEAGGPATVAVKMSVTTSDEDGADRLARMSSDDFRQILGGSPSRVSAATTDNAPVLPAALQPGSTYSGWIAFTVDSAARSVRWQPTGTAWWTFTVPAATVTAPETVEPEVTLPEEPAVTPEEPAVTPEEPTVTPEPEVETAAPDEPSESPTTTVSPTMSRPESVDEEE